MYCFFLLPFSVISWVIAYFYRSYKGLNFNILSDGLQALLAPSKVIATNAGVDGEVVVEKTKTCDWQTGYNAMSGRYEDLINAGVVDPCRVSRCALQNAVSVAGIVLTTQAIMVEKTKKPKPPVPLVPRIAP